MTADATEAEADGWSLITKFRITPSVLTRGSRAVSRFRRSGLWILVGGAFAGLGVLVGEVPYFAGISTACAFLAVCLLFTSEISDQWSSNSGLLGEQTVELTPHRLMIYGTTFRFSVATAAVGKYEETDRVILLPLPGSPGALLGKRTVAVIPKAALDEQSLERFRQTFGER